MLSKIAPPEFDVLHYAARAVLRVKKQFEATMMRHAAIKQENQDFLWRFAVQDAAQQSELSALCFLKS